MIKNIIFDLGGVILNIDFQRSADEFKKLGIKDFDQLYSRAVQNYLFIGLELGNIDGKSFRNSIRKLSNIDLSDKEIDIAWNAIILDFPKDRLRLIAQINKNYNCFLLSNTNKIHYDVYNNDLKANHNINGLESMFNKAYFSHDMRMRKPDAEIYEFVLHEQQIEAKETLFVDDSIQNIDAAKALGLQTLFIDISKGQEISDFFENGKLKDS